MIGNRQKYHPGGAALLIKAPVIADRIKLCFPDPAFFKQLAALRT